MNEFRCCGNVRPVFVEVLSSALLTMRRDSSSPSADLIDASRYCADEIGATRSFAYAGAETVGRAASTAVASTSGAATVSGVFSTTASLSVGVIGSAGSSTSSAAISNT